jgi:hypothetical protein
MNKLSWTTTGPRYRKPWTVNPNNQSESFGEQWARGFDGTVYRIQDDAPGSDDGHPDRDWSAFAQDPDGRIHVLALRTSAGKAYQACPDDHNSRQRKR